MHKKAKKPSKVFKKKLKEDRKLMKITLKDSKKKGKLYPKRIDPNTMKPEKYKKNVRERNRRLKKQGKTKINLFKGDIK